MIIMIFLLLSNFIYFLYFFRTEPKIFWAPKKKLKEKESFAIDQKEMLGVKFELGLLYRL